MSDSKTQFSRAAMITAAVMLSYQTAGKAARDAIFLSNFDVKKLPAIVMGAALLSIFLGFLVGRWMERRGPASIVPRLYLFSGVLQLVEFAFYETAPALVAPVIYLHIVGLGAILLSGFWSVASEQLNPREAKKIYGQIAGVGTLGGIVGGILAERVGAWFGIQAVLIQLAVSHLVCGAVLLYAGRFTTAPVVHKRADGPEDHPSAWETFSRVPYLGGLAALVLLGTSSAAIVDFLFKSQAKQTVGSGPELLQFFAIFHTVSAVLTFFMQTFVARLSFEKLGLTRSVGSLPAIVGVGSLTSLAFPFFPVILVTRLLELVFRGSVFRSGYELFYIPIPAREKRGVKSLIDVACDRMGDAVGSAAIQAALITAPNAMRNVVLGIAAISAGISLWIASRLDRAYQDVVRHGLMDRADELDLAYVEDVTTLSSVMNTVSSFSVPRVKETPKPAAAPKLAASDELLDTMRELRSNDQRRVLETLARMDHLDAVLAPQLIRLMAWNEVTVPVRQFIAKYALQYAGLLVDFLLDESQDFAIRRRIPRVLAATQSQRAIDGLLQGLEDRRFEVRFQCGRALDFVCRQSNDLRLDPERIYDAVEREISVNKSIWDGRRLLDQRESSDEFSFLDEVLRERAHQSLEHVFSLLCIVLPREALKVSFRALHSGDPTLRALALEYLEGVLPERLRAKMLAVLEASPVPASEETRKFALEKILASNEHLAVEWRKRATQAADGSVPGTSGPDASKSPARR